MYQIDLNFFIKMELINYLLFLYLTHEPVDKLSTLLFNSVSL